MGNLWLESTYKDFVHLSIKKKGTTTLAAIPFLLALMRL